MTPPAKVVIFFYGGSWRNGSKTDYRFVAQALTSRGFIVVLPDYRVYPQVIFPAFVEDGALAVRWVRDNDSDIRGRYEPSLFDGPFRRFAHRGSPDAGWPLP